MLQFTKTLILVAQFDSCYPPSFVGPSAASGAAPVLSSEVRTCCLHRGVDSCRTHLATQGRDLSEKG